MLEFFFWFWFLVCFGPLLKYGTKRIHLLNRIIYGQPCTMFRLALPPSPPSSLLLLMKLPIGPELYLILEFYCQNG